MAYEQPLLMQAWLAAQALELAAANLHFPRALPSLLVILVEPRSSRPLSIWPLADNPSRLSLARQSVLCMA